MERLVHNMGNTEYPVTMDIFMKNMMINQQFYGYRVRYFVCLSTNQYMICIDM